jgi:hypothetical protein
LKDFEAKRTTYKGLRVYAIDGDQMELPLSQDILKNGYRGVPVRRKRETYFPRLYLLHGYDVLSGVTKAVSYSHEHKECEHSALMIEGFEEQSLTLYDRLFFSRQLVRNHAAGNTFFLARCKIGRGVMGDIQAFTKSSKKTAMITLDGIKFRVVKIKNPRSKKIAVFATNLPKRKFSDKEIAALYRRRWEVETSFRDLTHTMKLEQWHSKLLNGVLQELFALLWLINTTKIQMALALPNNKPLENIYKRANFKATCECMIDNFKLLFTGKIRQFFQILLAFILRSVEARTRLKRAYPRRIRSRRRTYPCHGLVKRRALTERH